MATKRVAHKITLTANAVLLGGVRSLSGPGHSRDIIDVTDLDADITVPWPSPVLELGECTFTLFWDREDTAGHVALELLLTDPLAAGSDPRTKIKTFIITFPFGLVPKQTFSGWIKDAGALSFEVKGEVTRDLTVQVTSIPVDSA